MSNNQLAGFPAFGPRVDTSITYNPVSYIPESPIELPTSEPAVAQVQLTVNAASLPTFSPCYPSLLTSEVAFKDRYKVFTVAYFQNLSASSVNIIAKFKSSETPTFTSITGESSLGATYYDAVTFVGSVTELQLNTIHEVKFYTSYEDVYLIWAYMVVVPDQLIHCGATAGLKDLLVTVSNASWVGSAVVSTATANFGWGLNLRGGGGGATVYPNVNGNVSSPAFSGNTSYAWLLTAPSLNTTRTTLWKQSTTANTNHFQPYYPTRIAYTPIL